MTRAARALYAAGAFAFLLTLWQVLVKLAGVPVYFIPAPLDILWAMWQGRGLYITHFGVTLFSTLAGFAIAFALGAALGTLVSEVPFLERTLYPVLVAVQAMPRIALAPIIIVWFGFGPSSKIVLGAFSAFFPIFLNMAHGLAVVGGEQVTLMRSFRATRSQIFWKVKLPNALPFLLAGTNIGIIFAMLSTIVAEFLGSNQGMGFLIVQESNRMDTAAVFATVFILSAAGLVFHYAVQYVRQRLLFWSKDSELAESI